MTLSPPYRFIGVDVQMKRRCSYLVLDEDCRQLDSGWLEGEDNTAICQNLKELVNKHRRDGGGEVAIGIDAPRMPLPAPRQYFWKGNSWVEKTSSEKGYGRHCEVVIKSLNIGNPQWTRPADQSPPWMHLGYALFAALTEHPQVFEAYPAASFFLLKDRELPLVTISFANFKPGPRDMLDACIAALTVHQFMHGLGSQVGGGDGLGTIILPVPLPVSSDHRVLNWPQG